MIASILSKFMSGYIPFIPDFKFLPSAPLQCSSAGKPAQPDRVGSDLAKGGESYGQVIKASWFFAGEFRWKPLTSGGVVTPPCGPTFH